MSLVLCKQCLSWALQQANRFWAEYSGWFEEVKWVSESFKIKNIGFHFFRQCLFWIKCLSKVCLSVTCLSVTCLSGTCLSVTCLSVTFLSVTCLSIFYNIPLFFDTSQPNPRTLINLLNIRYQRMVVYQRPNLKKLNHVTDPSKTGFNLAPVQISKHWIQSQVEPTMFELNPKFEPRKFF